MAETKHQRVIDLDDTLLRDMVVQKAEMVEQGRAISKQQEELAKQHEKLGKDLEALTAKLNNQKLNIIRRTQKLAKTVLSEFEIPVTTELRDGKVVLIVTDALTEFKDRFNDFDKWREPVPLSRKEKQKILAANK